MTMRGSGIYSVTKTSEIVCKEHCWDCENDNKTCENYWSQDFETDDWGNIEQSVTCKSCNHSMTFKEEND